MTAKTDGTNELMKQHTRPANPPVAAADHSDLFADRIADVPKSFIREILKATISPSVISFAGGLPNRDLFPLEELHAAADKVFVTAGKEALQYSTSEGYLPLREYIAARYRDKQGLEIPVDHIMITSGSQQGLDLLGKTFLNDGDEVIIEEPGYLGAIQAFSVYKARFNPVPVGDSGMDAERLRQVANARKNKLFYLVPNFQNPSGISYSEENRRAVAAVMAGTRTLLIEDDPYGDLRFSGTRPISFKKLLPDQTILLGSFSKTVAPGFRLGWIVAPKPIMEKLVIAKQASDLHTNYFCQRVVSQYLADHELDRHIARITAAYGTQCEAMRQAIREFFPTGIAATAPAGGMFLWATLPERLSSMALFELAVKDDVVFVPGNPFYVNRQDTNTLRLNFSCVDPATIRTGIERLGRAIRVLMG